MHPSPAPSLDAFLTFLTDRQVLQLEAAQRVRGAARNTGQPVDVIMTELGVLRDAELADRLAEFCDMPRIAAAAEEEAALVAELGLSYAGDFGVLPLGMDGERLRLGVCNPFDTATLSTVSYYFDRELSLVSMTRSEISASCVRLTATLENGPDAAADAFSTDAMLEEDAEKLQDIALSAPVVSLVSRITQKAFAENATDIHIEPLEDKVQIRLRKDGMLVPLETVGKAMHAGIASRIKILARLNIVERRLPQDGRMRLSIRGQEVDFRVSVVPSAHGETIALRLLHNRDMSLDIAQLGYDEAARRRLEGLARHANGIVVISGPTGSGKTTTLYSLISMLNRPERKIFTVEDPVEYRVDGITQLQVNPALGLDFARSLRSILRQDPDIILVGEIRDRETAQIAIQAALTGHLVLTTLHTNSAAGALTRLSDMGIEPYLIGATVRGIVAQRLVRKICTTCHGDDQTSCASCGASGYRGRTVVYEILEVTPHIGRLVGQGESEPLIEERAIADGMMPLVACGRDLMRRGITSNEEIGRVVGIGGVS